MSIIDYDYNTRMGLLIELMELDSNKPVRKLLKECLSYYPLYYTSTQRHWLSIDTAFKAADIIQKRNGLTDKIGE